MPKGKRTKQRVDTPNFYPITRIMGIRWYMNRLENALWSIAAEHPDKADPYRVVLYAGKKQDIYTRMWNALATCEAQLLKIKKIHHPPLPPNMKPPKKAGCYCNDDCPPGWHCNQDTWRCEPGGGDADTKQYL